MSDLIDRQPEKRAEKCTETHACDCISREAAIDQLHQSYNLLDAEQRMEDLPSAQPEPRWIPCSDRLPKDEEDVIVSIHDDSGDCALDYSSSGWYAAAGEFWVVDNEANMCVTAWMPLPHPYREVSES